MRVVAGVCGAVAVAAGVAAVVAGAAPARVAPVGVAPVGAGAGPQLSVAPNPARFGEHVTIRGRGWPVNEFCRARVRLSLRSDQNAFTIGVGRIRASGRFSFHWTPRRDEVGPGAWRLVARQRCESGDDGSAVFVRRRVPLRIR
jgi:hypothetical protein